MTIYYIYKGDKPRVAQVRKRYSIFLIFYLNSQEFRSFNTFCKDFGKLMILVCYLTRGNFTKLNIFGFQKFEKKFEKICFKCVKNFCEKLVKERETQKIKNVEKVKVESSEDSQPKLCTERPRAVPIARTWMEGNRAEDPQHITAVKVEKPGSISQSISLDNLLDNFSLKDRIRDRNDLDFDKVRKGQKRILWIFDFIHFQFDRSRRKEKLSLNLGNNNLSVNAVSPRGHSDSRMKIKTSDLSPRPRKSSNVSKTTKTEVRMDNGKRIERRTETIMEDGRETKLIFENDKLGKL